MLAKKWHSDHNTFHLPTDEMTVTSKDVYRILRIPIVGDNVFYDLTEQGGTNSLRRIFHDEHICGYDITW